MKLSKLTLLMIFVFCSISSALCLPDWGLSVGLTNSIHDFNTYYPIGARWEVRHKLGYNIGVYIDVLKHRYLFSRLSTSFAQKGANINIIPVVPEPSTSSYNNNLYYINISLLEGIEFSSKHVKPYVLFGARYDILISKDIKKLNSFYDHFKTNIFGLSGGIGLKFNALSFPFFTEIIYNHDITDSQAKLADSEDFQKIKNKSIDFKIGIEF